MTRLTLLRARYHRKLASPEEMPMKLLRAVAILSAGLAAYAAPVGPALADVSGDLGYAYYTGHSPSSVKACPMIAYQFRGLSATPVGYVWFMDASGVSKATGKMDLTSGKFSLSLTSLDGNGPTGEVEGVRDPETGVVTAELKGPGCSNRKLLPMPPTFDPGNG